MTPSAYSIGIAGTGLVAQALGRLLNEGGQPIIAIAGRDPERTARAARFISAHTPPTTIEEIPALGSHLLIAVSDSAVERCCFAPGSIWFPARRCSPHVWCEGTRGVGRPCPPRDQLRSLPRQGVAAVAESNFAIDGDPEPLARCSSIVTLVGGLRLRIRPEDRSLSHAAAVMASSCIAAVICGALEMLKAAGIELSMALSTLAPLARTCTENSFHFGPTEALTGPIERGDSTTVLSHLKSLRNVPTPVKRLYCSAGLMVLQMALQRGLSERKATEIGEM